jgi:hypothetical protein
VGGEPYRHFKYRSKEIKRQEKSQEKDDLAHEYEDKKLKKSLAETVLYFANAFQNVRNQVSST